MMTMRTWLEPYKISLVLWAEHKDQKTQQKALLLTASNWNKLLNGPIVDLRNRRTGTDPLVHVAILFLISHR